MRKIFIIVLFLSAFLISGFSQKLMPTIYDSKNIKANADTFKGKPLASLLNHIGPEIKTVFVSTNRPHNGLSSFIFKFITKEDQKMYDRAKKRSLSILVYVKENFNWSKQGQEAIKWTQKDAQTYGDLTIFRVGVIGESL